MKTVFICTDQQTENVLQNDSNLWTRAAKPLYIGDMDLEEAIKFVKKASEDSSVLEQSIHTCGMHEEYVAQIVDAVGGRPCRLLSFIYDWSKGIPFEESLNDLIDKETDMLVSLSKTHEVKHVLKILKKQGLVKKEVLLRSSSHEVISMLRKLSIIRCEDSVDGIMVKLDSRLVKDIVQQINFNV